MNVPGFIDLQINGYRGVDFSSPGLDYDDVRIAFDAIVNSGTAGFLPTVITTPPDTCRHCLSLLAQAINTAGNGRHALGIHVEGPFLCPEAGYIGAHNPAWTQRPDPALLIQMQDWAQGKIKAVTIAAGLPGARELTIAAREMGIAVFLGHQNCPSAELKNLADAGAVALTHLGNGLPNALNRFQNPLWAGLVTDELAAMVITDGHHVRPDLIKIILRMKGAERFMVVSDASPVAGLPPGRYFALGNEVLLEPSGYLHIPAKNCLAGSSANMLQCINYLATLNLLSAGALTAAGRSNPLQLLGMTQEQVPNPGYTLRFDEEDGCFRKK